MEIIETNGENRDFVTLCRLLDDNLNRIVGGEKQRVQYNQYNQLEDIHDVFIIYDQNLPIACASFKYHEKGTAEVKRVFVREEYRGRGLSLLLMKRLEEKAKMQGYQNLILETGNMLTHAMGLYKKIGFMVIENYGQYKNMKESICMGKLLI